MAPPEPLLLNRAVVFVSAIVYWSGVWLQARRVRRRIGRSPNVRPRSRKEKLLWAGWLVVVGLWLTIPFAAGKETLQPLSELITAFLHPVSVAAGIFLIVAGYAGTLWSYSAMGTNWRMGIDPGERLVLVTRGPFRFVRHPIYLFQAVMLWGLALLLPTPLSLMAIAIHLVCVRIKAADEESFLLGAYGANYELYRSRTGKLLPKFVSSKRESSLG